MMKRNYANRPNWSRIIEKRYKQKYIKDETFDGHISCLYLDKVRQPLVVTYADEQVCIVDDGYKWLMLFPKAKHYSLTIMINNSTKIVQWYFDIVKSNELTQEGIPFSYDLYLDCVLLPNGKHFMLDEDELDNALITGIISDAEHKIAKKEAKKIWESIIDERNELILRTENYMKYFDM